MFIDKVKIWYRVNKKIITMKKLEIRFLGTGNGLANDIGIYQSNLIVTFGGDRLFIDCGSDFQHALRTGGFTHHDIEHLYISHIHSDHAGGLESLGFISHFYRSNKAIKLYGESGVIKTLEQMLMSSMAPSISKMREKGLQACFDVRFVTHGFSVGEINCKIIKTLHVNAYEELYSYGLFITADNRSVLFTSDTQFNQRLFKKYYEKADLILHDCSTSPAVSPKPAHAHFDQLAGLIKNIKRKMVLYHYGPGKKPDESLLGFKGYAEQNVIYTV
jgi:ribonuclease BN (tRNA processing enzyme)